MVKWFSKLLGSNGALQPHASRILWHLRPHPASAGRRYDREIRDGSLRRLFSGAAYSHNILWDTRECMEMGIMGGRLWHDRWYRTSCRLGTNEDLFRLIFDFLP